MEGRFVHIVSDMRHMPAYEFTICALGIMGTKYEHPEPVQKSIEVIRGEQASFPVKHLVSSLAIGNKLQIAMR